jgi:hypothetical protein
MPKPYPGSKYIPGLGKSVKIMGNEIDIPSLKKALGLPDAGTKILPTDIDMPKLLTELDKTYTRKA